MKRRATTQLNSRLVAGLLAGAILAAGCASLPPAQTATDIKAISGMWQGQVQTTGGGFGNVTFVSTLTITDDGRYVAMVPSINPPTYVGTIAIVDGQYRYKSETTGGTGTFTLHEGDGKRALVQQFGNGTGSALYWAAK